MHLSGQRYWSRRRLGVGVSCDVVNKEIRIRQGSLAGLECRARRRWSNGKNFTYTPSRMTCCLYPYHTTTTTTTTTAYTCAACSRLASQCLSTFHAGPDIPDCKCDRITKASGLVGLNLGCHPAGLWTRCGAGRMNRSSL